METKKYQFFAIVAVFTFGFFSHDLFSGTEHDDDIYYQDTAPLLQCTINLDCDNRHDGSIFFPKEEVPQHMYQLEVSQELQHHRHYRMWRVGRKEKITVKT